MATDIHEIENRLWQAADELRANSRLKSSEYSIPVLGLIFLRYADARFADAEKELAGKATGRRRIGKANCHARGVLYLPDEARFSALLDLPEGGNIGQAINDAMKAIEADNEDLKGVLPKTYNRLENSTLVELLKLMSSIPADIEGDVLGKVFEYFPSAPRLGQYHTRRGEGGSKLCTLAPTANTYVASTRPRNSLVLCNDERSPRMTRGRKPKPTQLELLEGNPGKRPLSASTGTQLPGVSQPAFLPTGCTPGKQAGGRNTRRLAPSMGAKGALRK